MKTHAIRLIQITDTHLFTDPSETLLGLNTEQSLQSVLALIKQEQPNIDLILATGDITQRPSKAAYCRFSHHIQQFNVPYYCLLGNHDKQDLFSNAQQDNTLSTDLFSIDLGSWAILMLDSTLENAVGGHFTAQRLAILQQALEKTGHQHVLIAFHHPPVAVGCQWLDKQRIDNSADFWKMLENFTQVRAIICGHVHQAFHTFVQGIPVYTTPSTCVQFKPNSPLFALDKENNAGYRWLDLMPDGQIHTDLSRIAQMPEGTVWLSEGYE